MDLDQRAVMAGLCGLGAMALGSTGCMTCGIAWVVSIPLGAVAFMMARGVRVESPDRWSQAWAWSEVAYWSGAVGGGFGLLATVSLILYTVVWIGGFTWML